MKYICDIIITGVICISSISTATFATLQYLEYINNWEIIVISSGVTIVSVLASVMRKANNRLQDINNGLPLAESSDT